MVLTVRMKNSSTNMAPNGKIPATIDLEEREGKEWIFHQARYCITPDPRNRLYHGCSGICRSFGWFEQGAHTAYEHQANQNRNQQTRSGNEIGWKSSNIGCWKRNLFAQVRNGMDLSVSNSLLILMIARPIWTDLGTVHYQTHSQDTVQQSTGLQINY